MSNKTYKDYCEQVLALCAMDDESARVTSDLRTVYAGSQSGMAMQFDVKNAHGEFTVTVHVAEK